MIDTGQYDAMKTVPNGDNEKVFENFRKRIKAMGKQFNDVNTSRGAPMGRKHDHHLEIDLTRSVRLFQVRLDSGGYDDGGAYWGTGTPLWCAQDMDGNQQFIRAASRESAAFKLGIPNKALKRPLYRGGTDYGLALIDGRAPMPEIHKGAWDTVQATKQDVIEWLRQGGSYAG